MDLDGDGQLDLLSGSYSRYEPTMAGLFQVLAGRPGGKFSAPKTLQGTDGEPLIIPIKDENEQTLNICTRPAAVDWDGDGRLDLIVGNFAGTFYKFRGEGRGKFAPVPEALLAGDEPLRIKGAHGDPFVIDLDGDGDLDLVSGSSVGNVQWAENTAGKGRPPQLKQFVELVKVATTVPYGEPLSESQLAGPVSSTRVWVDDVDGDGKLDLLVGDQVTLVAPAPGLTVDEYKRKLAAWTEEFQKTAQANANDPAEAEKFNLKIMDLYKRRAAFQREESTGFVWLYRGK